MRQRIVLILSGAIAVGKSTLAAGLADHFGFFCIKTSSLLLSKVPPNPTGDPFQAEPPKTRDDFQRLGDKLDADTGGAWLAKSIRPYFFSREANAALVSPGQQAFVHAHSHEIERLLVDAARTADQIAWIRKMCGNTVVHVHLAAPLGKLAQRYFSREQQQAAAQASITPDSAYEDLAVQGNATEMNVHTLASIADVVIDTTNCTAEDVLVRVAGHLGLYGRSQERLVDVLVGGCWGSEGKGQVSAYLSKDYDVLVRVGGPNAGHKVWEGGEQKSYTFYHLPSGTRCTNAKLILGAGSVIGLTKLLEEIAECGITPDRLSIDPKAVIIDPQDVDLERQAGSAVSSIGSTGQGVGAATARKVLRTMAESHFHCANQLAQDNPLLKPFIRDTVAELERYYAQGKRIFLEGTQGTHLSLHHGQFPYVTSRDTTVQGTLSDAGIPASRVRKAIMVCRSYPIRVQSPDEKMQAVEGASSGPMGQEISWREVAGRSGYDHEELAKAEMTSTTKRRRRVAEFHWPAFRRAVTLNGPTDIALTFADYYGKENADARRYEQLNEQARRQCEEMERVAGVPVSLIAVRFRHRSIIDRRNW